MRSPLLASTLLSIASTLPAAEPPSSERARADEHPLTFWPAIAKNGFQVPEGEDAYDLLAELFRHLGAKDPALRDDCGYTIAYHWIVRRGLIDGPDCAALTELLLDQLGEGLGEVDTESVLLRSFSALDLSLLARRDLEAPFLERGDFEDLLERTCEYLEEEKDVRGHHPQWGWIHSVAHTADLLGFLSRSSHLDAAGQSRILDAVARKTTSMTEVLTHGEDERMAAALHHLLSREDFDTARFDTFLARLTEGVARRPGAPAFDPAQHAARQNTVQLLRALFVLLSRSDSPAPHAEELRARLLAFLSRS